MGAKTMDIRIHGILTLRRTFSFALAFIAIVLYGGVQRAWAQPIATTTSLAVTSGGSVVTTIPSGSVLTLTATVNAGTSAVTTGQVRFCDADVNYCTDIHLLGTVEVTSAGTASIKFIPGIGAYRYKAIFAGTNGYATSSSSESALAVTGLYATTTSISSSGNPGNYSLTATVNTVGPLSPTETVSFLDTTSGNYSLGTGVLGSQTTGLSFVNSSTPATGLSPRGATVGDFNNDGIPDLAIPNGTLGAPLTILLGKGDGTFTSSSLSTGTNASFCRIVVADFNADGNQDIAAQSCGGIPGNNIVLVFLGHGDGTFTAVASTTVPLDPDWTAVGDFNGDGKLDLAVVHAFSPYLTILLGNGDGTFTPAAASSALPYSPLQVAAADFNGDGKADLVVSPDGDGSLTILLGNGDGTFTPTTTSPTTGIDPNAVAIADFNGDGKLDLAVTTGGTVGNDTLTILLGNGDGTFTPVVSDLSVGVEPQTITVGDFNGDGKADLAIANFGSDTLTVLLGQGDGAFSPASTSPATGPSPYSAVAADFNGDGRADLAAVSNAGNSVKVLLSNPSESSTASLSGVSPLGAGTHQVEASYPGNSNNAASLSSTIGLTAQQGKPTVQVTPSSVAISTIQALSVTMVVSDGAAPTPSGTVTLTSGNYSSSATSLTNGDATINIPAGSLPAGTDTLTANYSGDSNYVANSGSASVTVTAPTFTVTGTPVSLPPGATTGNTSTVTVTPISGFTGSVALTAAITGSPAGAQDPPSLSFGSTSPVNIAGPNPGTATLTVSTTAATHASLADPRRPGVPWYAKGGATLACVLLLFVPRRRRGWQRLLGMLGILFLTGGIFACGGGGKSIPGTTAGAYTITVTCTSGSITATNTVTLTVQ